MERTEIAIYLTKDKKTFKACARLMADSEPWKSLQRDMHGCLSAFLGTHKEVYVALEKEKIVGFAILQMAGTFKGYIQSIMVLNENRGQGIGTHLLKYCEERIFKASPNIFMCVSSFNTGAASLYEKLGYQKIGELQNFIIDGHSEFLLRKTIGPISNYMLCEP
jgi:[ribosomal protein S18]-alanine N-acetyltransferase